MRTITDKTLAPLTREEMATYIDVINKAALDASKKWETYCQNQTNAFTSALERLEKTYNDRVGELVTSLGLLFNAQVDQNNTIESLRKTLFVVNKTPQIEPVVTNAKFTNSLSALDTAKWINDVWKACEMIGAKSGFSKIHVLKSVYKNLRNKQIDIDGLYREYKRSTGDQCAMIVMIGRSDYLRPLVEQEIKGMYDKYFPKNVAQKEKKICNSVMARKNPKVIDDLIERYATATDINSRITAKKTLYKKMRNIVGDCRAEKQLFERNNHVSKCSFGYFVANTSMLLNVMTNIVEESENNGK